jgi:hypothetical protein
MDRSPMTMPKATPHDQLDRAPQSLTKREVQACDGSDGAKSGTRCLTTWTAMSQESPAATAA